MGFKSYNIDTVFSRKIKMYEYNIIPNDVRTLINYTIANNLKPNPVLRLGRKNIQPKGETLWYLSWDAIIQLRSALVDNDLVKSIELVYGLNKKQFTQLEIFNAYAAYLWIVIEFKNMIETEIEQLSFELDEDEKNAGTEDLQDFGYAVALDGLAGGDILKYDQYLRLPYTKVFRKLCMDKTRYEINKNMQKNASRNIRTNS